MPTPGRLQRKITRIEKMLPDDKQQADVSGVGELLPAVQSDRERHTFSPAMQQLAQEIEPDDEPT